MNSDKDPEFSEEKFWDKLKHQSGRAGREVVHLALKLYYATRNPRTPRWAKTAILGALVYFISPIDAVPDFIPLAGFTDDMGVLTAALATVAFFIDDSVKSKAQEKLKQWFKD